MSTEKIQVRLDADPRNPTDLIGAPINEGDTLVWATTYGRSAALNIGRLVSINYRLRGWYGGYRQDDRCEREQAGSYTLTVQPLIGTGNMREAKPRTLQNIKNVLKVDDAILEG